MTLANLQKRTCMGICKQYKIKKPAGMGKYESGQARCQICDIWIDHNGCILKNRSNATINSAGWICKCCNYIHCSILVSFHDFPNFQSSVHLGG